MRADKGLNFLLNQVMLSSIIIETLSLKLRLTKESGFWEIMIRGVRMLNVFTEINQATNFRTLETSAEVGNQKWRVMGLTWQANEARESIKIFANRLMWLLSDPGEFIDAHESGIRMTKVLDEESFCFIPGKCHGVGLPKLEISKVGELIE
jgi:hypothetical protein